jgi:hypothetical protein
MVSLLAAACSSDNSKNVADGGADNGTGGHGTGGHGGGGGSATGGGSSAPMCAADTGGDSCRKCLANNCCDEYTMCLGDPKCDKALTTQIACFTSGDEPSFCFGNFARALGGDAGTITPVPACIVSSCTAVCGGPGIV